MGCQCSCRGQCQSPKNAVIPSPTFSVGCQQRGKQCTAISLNDAKYAAKANQADKECVKNCHTWGNVRGNCVDSPQCRLPNVREVAVFTAYGIAAAGLCGCAYVMAQSGVGLPAAPVFASAALACALVAVGNNECKAQAVNCPPPANNKPKTVSVGATSNWTYVGNVTGNFTVSASPSTSSPPFWAGAGSKATPDGIVGSDCCNVCNILKNAKHMTLIGRINGGTPFKVGSSYTGSGQGRLELRVNDTCQGDNGGAYTATVRGSIN